MFNDIGALELVTLVVLAVLIFGPDKLPKVIQDISGFIRKVRDFSDNAKRDIRDELGPEFKDFEFEDLNPKTFIRKQLDNEELGIKEIRNGFDMRKEMAEVTDSVNGRDSDSANGSGGSGSGASTGPDLRKGGGPDLEKRPENPEKRPANPEKDERPPFDYDAT